MIDEEYRTKLINLLKQVFVIRPYRSGKLYFCEAYDIAYKINNAKLPYFGQCYNKIIKSDNEMNIARIIYGTKNCKRYNT